MAATVIDALRYWARQQPNSPAIVLRDEETSYSHLDDWTAAGASVLRSAGVEPGDRVGVIGQNTLQWCASALSVMRSGAVLVPLNNRLVSAELTDLVRDSGTRLIISDDQAMERIETVCAASEGTSPLKMSVIDELRNVGNRPLFTYEDTQLDAASVIVYTSGSTGRSKGAVFTQRTLLSITAEWSLMEPGTFRPGMRTLLVLPLAFSPGTVWGICMMVTYGGLLVVEPGLDGQHALEALEKHRIEALFGPPIVFETIASAPGFVSSDLSSLKTTHTGGARVPVELLQKWMDKGVALRQIYGLTEAGGSITATSVEDAAEHPDSCGSGGIFTEFRIVSPDGSRCANGEPGEIIIRGPSVTPGYWGDVEATEKALRDGWLFTGDLGVVDEDGRLTFLDRLKDLIISGGINVSPLEIERIIAEYKGVEEVVVIPVPDERFGETAAAIVFGSDLDDKKIVEHCGSLLADYKVPRYVVVSDEPLPRLPGGKIARADVKASYADIPQRYERIR
jgi:fatty-acyl-CoA synthase